MAVERARQPDFFFWWLTVNVIEKILYLKKHDPAEEENKTDFLNIYFRVFDKIEKEKLGPLIDTHTWFAINS